jgi:hypothetical protein
MTERADVIGYVLDSTYYCKDCCPDSDAPPVYPETETDSWQHCAVCDALVEQKLNSDGVIEVLFRLERYLITRHGRPECLRQEALAMEGYLLNPADARVVSLAKDATDPASVAIAKKEMKR